MLYNNNTIRVEGTIGRDSETKFLNSGKSLCESAMAMNRGKKEQNLKPVWFKLKGFGDFITGQMMSLKKGDSVTVIGSFDLEEWEKDGIKHQACCIIVETIYRKIWPEKNNQCGQYPNSQQQNSYQSKPNNHQKQNNIDDDFYLPPDDSIPF